jgi:hypothetical protein
MGLHHQGSAAPNRLRTVEGPYRGLVLPDESGFALSLASDRGAQPTPAAAAWFARHGGLTGIPAEGWRQLRRSR